jgi:SulP family sulfate permease
MDASAPAPLKPPEPTFKELFTPKLVTLLREGYDAKAFAADATAGLTVAIVALPLSMAIAIGSGLSPEKGLFTAIVAGFLISALGGSRFQIGGPAGAFIVLVATIVERHGYDGLVLATAMAGLMMVAAGYLRLGTYIKYIPLPVTVGFTAGIAVIIFASQLRELLGLDIAHEPAALAPKLAALWNALGSINPSAVAISLLAVGLIVGLRRYRPKWPGLLIAVAVTTLATALLSLDIATVGSRFGEVPRTPPSPSLPAFDLAKLRAVFPDAVAIALLGAIESLLSAVVADGMSGRKHRSNCELVAQGVANIASVMFGGMCATGTIARTATNVRAGARTPVSGMLHSVYLLLFMAVAAPLATYIPLASLGGVLAVVAWNMAEKEEFAGLLRASWGDATVLMATFLLTIFEDLTIAIGVGVTLGAFLFLHRLADVAAVESGAPLVPEDKADGAVADRIRYDPGEFASDISVYRLSGAMFFASTAAVRSALDRIGERPKVFILDFEDVPIVDSTAANTLKSFAEGLERHGTVVYFSAVSTRIRRTLFHAGLRPPLVRYAANVQEAAEAAQGS